MQAKTSNQDKKKNLPLGYNLELNLWHNDESIHLCTGFLHSEVTRVQAILRIQNVLPSPIHLLLSVFKVQCIIFYPVVQASNLLALLSQIQNHPKELDVTASAYLLSVYLSKAPASWALTSSPTPPSMNPKAI